MTRAKAPTLDRYVNESYEVIRYVHDHLPEIRAIAARLTPVEDLVEFQAQIELLYARLTLLVEASQIIIQITDAGFAMITARDAAAQRALLGLGSAALRSENFFAKEGEFQQLKAVVEEMLLSIEAILHRLDTFATKEDLEALKQVIEGKIGELADQVGSEIIENQEVTFEGETYVGLARAFEALYARITLLADGLMAEAGKILQLQTRLANHDRTLEAISTVQEQLLSRTQLTEDGLLALGEKTTRIETSVEDLEEGMFAEGGAVDQLRSQVTIQGDRITSESERTTELTGRINDARHAIEAQAAALSGIRTRLNSTEDTVTLLSEESTQLGVRLDNTEQGLVAQGEASEALRTEIEQTKDALTINSENVTNLRASLGGTSNLLPHSDFEGSLVGWTVFLRGTGWTTGEMVLDLDAETMIPDGVHALGIQVTGVPSGEFGIRSQKIPVQQLKNYIASGYLAARNCTARLEWRAFNERGGTVEFGSLGSVTGGGGKRLADWKRVFDNIPISLDVTHIELQLRISGASFGSPKAWLMRPMVEEVSAMQQYPSPWTPSAVGIGSIVAEANQELRALIEETEERLTALSELVTELETQIGEGEVTAEAFEALRARVEITEQGIESVNESITGLVSRLGAVVDWVLYVDPNTPTKSSLKRIDQETPTTFTRGLTLIRFGSGGEIQQTSTYDIFAGAAQRNAFIAAATQVPNSQYVLVIGQPNLGAKTENVNEVMNSLGAQFYESALGSRAYALLGRGGLGKGNGVEVIQRDGETHLMWAFTLVNGVPRAIAERFGMSEAYSRLSTQITETADNLELLTEDITQIGSSLETFKTATNKVTDQLSTRITENKGELTSIAQRQTTIEASIGGTANLVGNSDFSNGLTGWLHHQEAGRLHEVAVIGPPADWALNDAVSRTLNMMDPGGPTGAADYAELQGEAVAIDSTKRYQLSAYLGMHRANGVVFGYFLDNAGNNIGNTMQTQTNSPPGTRDVLHGVTGGASLAGYGRAWMNFTVPAGATRLVPVVRKGKTLAGTSSYMFATRVMLTEVPETNNAPLPWQPSARGAAALDARVTTLNQARVDAEGALAQSISNVATTADNASNAASQALTAANNASSAVTTVSSSLTGGGNLLRNASFMTMRSWNVIANSWGATIGVNIAGPQWQPPGTNNICFVSGGTPNTSSYCVVDHDHAVIPVTAGEQIFATVYAAAHRCRAAMEVMWFNASGTHILTNGMGESTSGGGNNLSGWTRIGATNKLTVPANAAAVSMRLVPVGTGQNNPYAWYCLPMIEKATPGQTQASPWAAGGAETASVVQSMTANVGPGGAYAQAMMMTDVNGRLVGTRTTNNGSEGIIDMLADKVRISSPNGGARTEYSDGNWRIYGASGQLRVRLGVWN